MSNCNSKKPHLFNNRDLRISCHVLFPAPPIPSQHHKFFSLLPSQCIFLLLDTFLCFSCPKVFLPLSLSCVRPPLRGLFLSFSQVKRFHSLALFRFTGDEFVSLSHIYSPSISLLLTSFVFVVPPDISDVRLPSRSLSLALHFTYTPSRSILTNTPLVSLFLADAHTYTYPHAFIWTRTCQPRLGSTKYARVSPRATLVMSRACALRVHVHTYTRVQGLVTVAFIRA